jgi:protein-disulfide isomerase
MEENKTSDAEKAVEEKEADSCCSFGADKKTKNLISLIILLFGLLIGSIFVDVVQIFRGGGFSPRKLAQTDIFNFGGKTWVAYSEPIVKIQVISDETCEACNADEVVLALQRMVPTILTSKVDINSQEGRDLTGKMGIKTLPAFVFSQDIEKTDFFGQAAAIFNKVDNSYVLNTAQLGIQPGKYIEALKAEEDDIQIGNKDSNVQVFLFSDFQCPYCKTFHESTVKKILTEYKDKVSFVFKNFPLNFHPQAENAALAGECANEQGKFAAYADKLFDTQTTWGKTTGTQSFKTYAAQTGLNVSEFNKCLDEKKYQDKINSDKELANNFGISGTPSMFINDQSISNDATFDIIKQAIDGELAK